MTIQYPHFGKALLFVMMIGLLIYFAYNACTSPYERTITPSERDSIERAKADSLRLVGLPKAKNDTVYKDSLNVVNDNADTTVKK